MLSVTIAKIIAMIRSAVFSCKNKNARGALMKDKLLDAVNMSLQVAVFLFLLYQMKAIIATAKEAKRKILNVLRDEMSLS